MAFKSGDTVRCVNASGVEEWLAEGAIYTVEHDSDDPYVTLRGVPKSYVTSRFVTVSDGDRYVVGVEVPAQDLGDFISRAVDAGYGINFVTKEG